MSVGDGTIAPPSSPVVSRKMESMTQRVPPFASNYEELSAKLSKLKICTCDASQRTPSPEDTSVSTRSNTVSPVSPSPMEQTSPELISLCSSSSSTTTTITTTKDWKRGLSPTCSIPIPSTRQKYISETTDRRSRSMTIPISIQSPTGSPKESSMGSHEICEIRVSYDIVIIGERESGKKTLFYALRAMMKNFMETDDIAEADDGMSMIYQTPLFASHEGFPNIIPIKLACSSGRDRLRKITGSFFMSAVVVLVTYPLASHSMTTSTFFSDVYSFVRDSRLRALKILEESSYLLRDDVIINFVGMRMDNINPKIIEILRSEFKNDSFVDAMSGQGVRNLAEIIISIAKKTISDRIAPMRNRRDLKLMSAQKSDTCLIS